jgi:zinc protease
MGRDDDMARISVADLAGFHRRYYGPGNAVLSVVGDARPEEVMRLAARYFGDVSASPATAPSASAPTLARVSGREDVPVGPADGLVMLGFPLPPAEGPDSEAAAIAIGALSSGINCRLHRRLVREKQAATRVAADVTQLDGLSIAMVRAYPAPAITIATLERLMLAEVGHYADRGPTADEWEVASAQRETAWLRRLADYSGRADELSRQALLGDDPDTVDRLVAGPGARITPTCVGRRAGISPITGTWSWPASPRPGRRGERGWGAATGRAATALAFSCHAADRARRRQRADDRDDSHAGPLCRHRRGRG